MSQGIGHPEIGLPERVGFNPGVKLPSQLHQPDLHVKGIC